ncbi:MAG: DUF4173 domain-containing protein [Blastocatellia bacterium]
MENASSQNESELQRASWIAEPWRSSIVPDELPPDFQARNESADTDTPPRISFQTKFALGVLLVAVMAGVSGDALLRAIPWGLNVPVWVALLMLSSGALMRWRASQAARGVMWLAAPMIFFAGAWAWRDSVVLNLLAMTGLLLTLLLVAFRLHAGRMLKAVAIEYLQTALLVFAWSALGLLRLIFGDIAWRELPREGWAGKTKAVLRGVLIALPLLFLFGSLLAMADAVFGQLVGRIFSFDSDRVTAHLACAGFLTWITAGILRWLLMDQNPLPLSGRQRGFQGLGLIEIGTVLGSLNVLFLAFVLVQFRYLFGGRAHLADHAGLSYAEYARAGFFELVWVAALVLPLLLLAHWLLKKDQPRNELIFRSLAGVQIALVAVIMFSAVQRMRLYQQAFGLTELRFYTTAFMGWLALVLGWFGVTVLRGRRERFAFGAVAAGLLMIAALHVINPDAVIARHNLKRAVEGKGVDLNYLASLSADAAPAWREGLASLSETDQAVLIGRLQPRWLNASTDWRSWNWSRARARHLAVELAGRNRIDSTAELK